LDGYGVVNLSIYGGGAALGNDPRNYTVGPEWVVCDNSTNDQRVPSVAVDSKDNFVVAWRDGHMVIADWDIRMKMFDSVAGTQLGDEITVLKGPAWGPEPSIAVTSKDDIIVVWQEQRRDWNIYSKVFNSTTGGQVGDEIIVSNATWSKEPAVAVDSQDNFIVVWDDYRSGTSDDIYAKIFNSTTGAQVGDEISVSNEIYRQGYPSVAVDSKDNFIVAWEDYRSNSSQDIYMKRFNSTTGTQVGNEIAVSDTALWEQRPSVAVDSRDNVVVVWEDCVYGYWDWNISAKVYDLSLGMQMGDKLTVSNSEGSQVGSSVAMDSMDNFIVVWQDYHNNPNGDICAKVFNTLTGAQLTGEIDISTAVAGAGNPSVTVDRMNNFLIAYEEPFRENADMYARKLCFPRSNHPNGTLTTHDFAPSNLFSWDHLIASFKLQDSSNNGIALEYSTDGGATWQSVPVNGSLAHADVSPGKIRFRVLLCTTDYNTTPLLHSLKLTYTVNSQPSVNLSPNRTTTKITEPIIFDASGSSDPDGDMLTFGWSLSGQAVGVGPSYRFTSNMAGTYRMRVNVSDGMAVVSNELTITVTSKDPLATTIDSFPLPCLLFVLLVVGTVGYVIFRRKSG
jgi:hypothetical protein